MRERSISKRKAQMIQDANNSSSFEFSNASQFTSSRNFSSKVFKTKGHTSCSLGTAMKTQTERPAPEKRKKRGDSRNASSSFSFSRSHSSSDCVAPTLEPVRFLRPELNFYSYSCSEKFTGISYRQECETYFFEIF